MKQAPGSSLTSRPRRAAIRDTAAAGGACTTPDEVETGVLDQGKVPLDRDVRRTERVGSQKLVPADTLEHETLAVQKKSLPRISMRRKPTVSAATSPSAGPPRAHTLRRYRWGDSGDHNRGSRTSNSIGWPASEEAPATRRPVSTSSSNVSTWFPAHRRRWRPLHCRPPRRSPATAHSGTPGWR